MVRRLAAPEPARLSFARPRFRGAGARECVPACARSVMGRCGGLVVYVTSHGFGHLNRSVAVINRVPGEIPVTIRCHPNLFDHWRERLRRPAALEPHVADSGAINPPGDSNATDGAATLALAMRVHAEAMARVDDEADAL